MCFLPRLDLSKINHADGQTTDSAAAAKSVVPPSAWLSGSFLDCAYSLNLTGLSLQMCSHKKTTPTRYGVDVCFTQLLVFMKTEQMRDARTSRFQAVARRDLCSEAQS